MHAAGKRRPSRSVGPRSRIPRRLAVKCIFLIRL
jgi:hypothetical protein